MLVASLVLTPVFAGLGGFAPPFLINYKQHKMAKVMDKNEKFKVEKYTWISGAVSTAIGSVVIAPLMYWGGISSISAMVFGLFAASGVAALSSAAIMAFLYKPEKELENVLKKLKEGNEKLSKMNAKNMWSSIGAAAFQYGMPGVGAVGLYYMIPWLYKKAYSGRSGSAEGFNNTSNSTSQ